MGLAAALAFVLALPVLPPLPPPGLFDEQPPALSAASWLLVDDTAGVELASYRPDVPRPMASVTKIMTALVVRRHADLDEVVTISGTAAAVGESEVDLVPGERWTVRDLLTALMVRSANDAAVALAEHVGGSVEGFAELMNDMAAELGLEHTHFTNPHGLDDDEHYTSARDLVRMAKAYLADDVLATIARVRLVTFPDDPSGVPRRARNTNRLLGHYPGIVGLKTGFTSKAGRVLVAVAERNGRRLISVVMGSEDHFADTRELLEFGFETFGPGDRLLEGLVEEEGGGATPAPTRIGTAVARRLQAMPELPDGRWAMTSAAETPIGHRIGTLLLRMLGLVGEEP